MIVRSAATALLLLAYVACGSAEKEPKTPKKPAPTADKLLEQGIVAEKAGKTDEAEKKYRGAVKLDPKSYEPSRRLVELLLGAGRAMEAAETAEAYQAARPDDLKANHLLADAYIAGGDYRGADKVLTELIDADDSDATAFAKRGRARVMGKDLPRGIDDFRRAIELDPENPDYLVDLGSALLQQKKVDEAREELNKALAINENHPRANVLMGITYRNEFKLDDALRYHLRAARVAPDSARAHFELGITQNLRGDNLAAEKELERATQLEPGDPLNWYAYGEALRILGKFEAAIPAYRKTLELDPNHKKAPNKLGYVLFKAGKPGEAEVVLTEAVRNNPDDPYPYFNLGMVYAQADKYTLAVNAFRRFLDLAPKDDRDVPTAKKQIRLLRRKIKR